MREINSIAELPQVQSVYAMCGGRDRGLHIAYVGIAGKLRNRVIQHLVRRDSSVATGTSAATLLPDYITEVRWWEHAGFEDRTVLQAAEMVAFDVLEPALRSRGPLQDQVKNLYNERAFYENMKVMFSTFPTGRLILPTLEIAFDRITELEKKVAELEKKLTRFSDGSL